MKNIGIGKVVLWSAIAGFLLFASGWLMTFFAGDIRVLAFPAVCAAAFCVASEIWFPPSDLSMRLLLSAAVRGAATAVAVWIVDFGVFSMFVELGDKETGELILFGFGFAILGAAIGTIARYLHLRRVRSKTAVRELKNGPGCGY